MPPPMPPPVKVSLATPSRRYVLHRRVSLTLLNVPLKFAEDQYKLSSAANVSQLNRAIISGVEAGIFIQPKVRASRFQTTDPHFV